MSKFMDSPIVRIRTSAPRRQKLAEVLQISQQMVFPHSVHINVHISFAKPVKGMNLGREELMPAVIKIARHLLEEHLVSLRTAP